MKSRIDRWNEAVSDIDSAIIQARDTISSAIENLRDIQSEYQDWLDNLPEISQGSAMEEKLQAVCDLDLEIEPDDLSEIEYLVSEANSLDLPRGFGRD